ncbi:MAG: hypothetical protein OIN86_16595 [Candidatus Methanoperedens sp.]|nr:hypothetical protein [Candidatus Methanoperedens sp.]CAG1006581.1 hypothetical protein METP1_03357 [Methanosarcinales archaeon]
MVEDIGKIISNSFGTYTKNLNICIPFILNFFISILLVFLLAGFGFAGIFGSSLSNIENVKTPEEVISILLPSIMEHIIEIAILVMIIFLLVFFIQAYFTSGAIGMAIQATESGKSNISAMRDAGKKNLVNMFLAELLFGLLLLVGVVFIVPGAMKIDISQILTSENTDGVVLLFGGFLLWFVYLVILSILLAVFRYALVADNLGPLESMTTSLSFFKKNKIDVFLLFIFVLVVVLVFIIIDQIIGQIPVISTIWYYINFMISLLVISPLITIWWVRLYMTRTNKKLYFDDLLAHPDDLKGN